ncbi:hypothetical protein ACFXNW_24660 [Nocardia sp. NPDC059180]|uniref:hypothetical protein n=1 Tax=Nocardia sp. NPDC059180 TaxID=3346761 RepID=UPI0036A752BB
MNDMMNPLFGVVGSIARAGISTAMWTEPEPESMPVPTSTTSLVGVDTLGGKAENTGGTDCGTAGYAIAAGGSTAQGIGTDARRVIRDISNVPFC